MIVNHNNTQHSFLSPSIGPYHFSQRSGIRRNSIEQAANASETLFSRRVLRVLIECFTKFVSSTQPLTLRLIDAAQIHVRKTVAFITRRFQSPLQPQYSLVQLALLDKVSA